MNPKILQNLYENRIYLFLIPFITATLGTVYKLNQTQDPTFLIPYLLTTLIALYTYHILKQN